MLLPGYALKCQLRNIMWERMCKMRHLLRVSLIGLLFIACSTLTLLPRCVISVCIWNKNTYSMYLLVSALLSQPYVKESRPTPPRQSLKMHVSSAWISGCPPTRMESWVVRAHEKQDQNYGSPDQPDTLGSYKSHQL